MVDGKSIGRRSETQSPVNLRRQWRTFQRHALLQLHSHWKVDESRDSLITQLTGLIRSAQVALKLRVGEFCFVNVNNVSAATGKYLKEQNPPENHSTTTIDIQSNFLVKKLVISRLCSYLSKLNMGHNSNLYLLYGKVSLLLLLKFLLIYCFMKPLKTNIQSILKITPSITICDYFSHSKHMQTTASEKKDTFCPTSTPLQNLPWITGLNHGTDTSALGQQNR